MIKIPPFAKPQNVVNDSITISVKHFYRSENVTSWLVRRKYPAAFDTIYINVPILKRAGEHQLRVELDPVGLIVESSELDNIVNYYFKVVTTDFKIIQPTAFSASSFSHMIFLNLTFVQAGLSRIAELEIDTVKSFSTAVKAEVSMMEFSTSYSISSLSKPKRYYWRIKQKNSEREWTAGTFYLGDSASFSMGQSDSIAWQNNSFLRTAYLSNGGAQIVDTKFNLTAISAGFNDGRTGNVEVNGVNVVAPIYGTGHNIIVLDTINYSVVAQRRFDVSNNADESDSLAQFISTINNGLIVIDVVVDEGANNLKPSTRDMLKTIGSQYIDQLSWRDSWAIIGRKGAGVGSVPESYKVQSTGMAVVETTIVRKETSGVIATPFFGPFAKLSSFSMVNSIPAGTKIETKLVGVKYNNSIDTVLLSLDQNLLLQQTVNSYKYKSAQLVFTFSMATQTSPTIQRWSLSTTPAVELAVSEKSTQISQSQIMEGVQINFSSKIYNISSAPAESVTVQLKTNDSGIERILKSQTFIQINANDSINFEFTYDSRGKRGNHAFMFEIDPADSVIEQSKDNNSVTIPFTVLPDTLRPELFVTFDGIHVVNGDYVSMEPEIRVRYSDNNPSAITSADTTNFTIRLNNASVPFVSGTAELINATTPGEVEIRWTPTLAKGENIIQIFARDVSGNYSDTTTMFVNVASELQILDLYNIPNPFSKGTHFTFKLAGPVKTDEVSIKIYTVTGRLIQDINAPTKIGFNSIPWDGRDKDGDELGNSVYLYKVIVKQADKPVVRQAVSKLVKMK